MRLVFDREMPILPRSFTVDVSAWPCSFMNPSGLDENPIRIDHRKVQITSRQRVTKPSPNSGCGTCIEGMRSLAYEPGGPFAGPDFCCGCEASAVLSGNIYMGMAGFLASFGVGGCCRAEFHAGLTRFFLKCTVKWGYFRPRGLLWPSPGKCC